MLFFFLHGTVPGFFERFLKDFEVFVICLFFERIVVIECFFPVSSRSSCCKNGYVSDPDGGHSKFCSLSREN